MIFEVKTTGVCEAQPNLITFNLLFSHKNEEYEKAVDGIARDIIGFHKIMKEYAKPEDLKTQRYRVDKKMKKVALKDQYVFSHFEASQAVKWTIPYNKVKLFEILQLISAIGDNAPIVNFKFGLTDDSIAELENKCTEKALLLAKEKAESVKDTLGMMNAKFVKTAIVEKFETYRELSSDTCYEAAYKYAKKAKEFADELAESMEPEDVRVKINILSEFEIE